MRFKNKTVIVTGTSRGIGRTLVKYFADEGAVVVAVSRTSDLPSNNTRSVIWIRGDIRQPDALMDDIKRKVGQVDILVNNAGVICYKDLLEVSKEQIEEVFDTNIISTLLFSRRFVGELINENRTGVIVNTLSYAATIPSVGSGIYAASKAALTSLTRTMAAEWAPFGIRVNGYSPGVVETDMTIPAIRNNKEKIVNAIALHEIGDPSQMAGIVGFLASDDSEYMTGVNLDASGGKFIVQNAEEAWEKRYDGR